MTYHSHDNNVYNMLGSTQKLASYKLPHHICIQPMFQPSTSDLLMNTLCHLHHSTGDNKKLFRQVTPILLFVACHNAYTCMVNAKSIARSLNIVLFTVGKLLNKIFFKST